MSSSEVAYFPPGFEGHPVIYMLTVFSLMIVVLLALEWLWRIAWAIKESPQPLQHPGTGMNVVLGLMLLGILIRATPDLILIMRWSALTPAERQWWQLFDGRMDASSWLFMFGSWFVYKLGRPVFNFQLDKRPLPIHLAPTWRDTKRPLKIGAGCFVLAAALTYLR